MNFTYRLLTFYSFLCENLKYLYDFGQQKYNDLEMMVLNNTFTEVYFYDYVHMRKRIIRKNNSLPMILYLVFLKWLGYSTSQYTQIIEFFSPYMLLPDSEGLFEIVYYSNRESKRYYTKGTNLDKGLILHYLRRIPVHKCLHASLSDKYNVTWFINDHITSFHGKNAIKVIDIALILMINRHQIPPISEGYTLKVLEDDTLEEYTFLEHSDVILMHDE
jgi:hypothetical protein